MPRHVPGAVQVSVSRLLQGQFFATPPAWYAAVLRHPPALTQIHLPKQTSETRYGLTPDDIVFVQDQFRRRFYQDLPFELRKPKTLVEGVTLNPETGPDGMQWTALAQRTPNPTPEDNLFQSHKVSPSYAYAQAISEYCKLRHAQETASRFSAQELEAFGHEFDGGEAARFIQKTQHALEKRGVKATGQAAVKRRTHLDTPNWLGKWSKGERYNETFRAKSEPIEKEQAQRDSLSSFDALLGITKREVDIGKVSGIS